MNWISAIKSKPSLLILLITSVLPTLLSSICLYYLIDYEEVFLTLDKRFWFVFFIATTFTMALALTPTTFIALITGYFLGWIGLLGILPSYFLASIIGFKLAKKIDRGNFLPLLKEYKNISKITKGITENEFSTIVYARLSPAIPFAMLNVLLAFINVSFTNFIRAGIIGMLPRTILSIYIGTQAKNLMVLFRSKESLNWTQLAIACIFIFSAIGLYKIITQALNKASN